MPVFHSRWLDWEPPQTPFQRTDKTDRSPTDPLLSVLSVRHLGWLEGESAPVDHTSAEPGPIQKTLPKALIQRTDKADKSPCPTEEWDTETGGLVEWFEHTPAPAQPFRLAPGVFVARPAHFWEALRRDISASPSGPRARTGALREDLLKLAALFKGRP